MPLDLLSHRASKHQKDEEEVLPYRPAKPQLTSLIITNNCLPANVVGQRSSSLNKTTGQRNTWPLDALSSQAGSYAFDTTPTLVRTPWELERSRRPLSQWSRHSAGPRLGLIPSRVFETLPREIYLCVLDQLERLHYSDGSVCTSCLRKHHSSLSLVSKSWNRTARERLYSRIFLPTAQSSPRKRKYSLYKKMSRLQLLLRTLRESSGLASLVRELVVTDEARGKLVGDIGRADDGRSADILVELVSSCPELEHLSGYHLDVGSPSAGVHLALATRHRLKEHVWILRDLARNLDAVATLSRVGFVECHNNWARLETLVVCAETHDVLGVGTISAILHKLPFLKNLMVSGFCATDFHDGTLQTLPALRSLRLQDLPGVTDTGLAQLGYARLATSLESLTLIGLDILSLLTLRALLSSLGRIRQLTLQQDGSMQIPLGHGSDMLQPILAAPSVMSIHWDVRTPGPATEMLAESISHGGFPRLRTVRAPCDYEGRLQALCRPIAREAVTAEDVALIHTIDQLGRTRSLHRARLRAQVKVRELRKQPSMSVIVQDEGAVTHMHVIGSYFGDMRSNIKYSLEPDIEGSSEAIAQLCDILKPARGDMCWSHQQGSANDAMNVLSGEGGRQKERTVGLRRLF